YLLIVIQVSHTCHRHINILLTIHRLPTYNLFPYTTLFRSDKLGVELVEGRDLFVKDDLVFMRTTQGPKRVDVIYRRIDDEIVLQDRKSTRLNSSHQIISYAVFCLIKQKRTNNHR